MPREFKEKGREYIFTESIYPGQTYKARIKNDKFECFLERVSLIGNDGIIDIREYYLEVENMKNSKMINDKKIKKIFLKEFEKILNISYKNMKPFRRNYNP